MHRLSTVLAACLVLVLAVPDVRADEAPSLVPQAPAPRYEERPRYGLVAAGASVFGATYLLSVGLAYTSGEGLLAIPVLGPLFALGRYSRQPGCAISPGYIDDAAACYRRSSTNHLFTALMVVDALAQASGVVMLGLGLGTRKRVLAVLPSASPAGAGLAAVGTF